MTKIIKNGTSQEYIHKCIKCSTVFSYNYLDTYYENEVDRPIEEETSKKENLNYSCTPLFSFKLNTAMDGYNANDDIDQNIRNMQFQIDQNMKMQALQSMINSNIPPYPRTVYKTRKERYCICPSCAEENEVRFKRKTIISFLKAVIS